MRVSQRIQGRVKGLQLGWGLSSESGRVRKWENKVNEETDRVAVDGGCVLGTVETAK